MMNITGIMRKVLAAGVLVVLAAGANADDSIRKIISDSGIKGGLIVHLGCGDGKLTATLKTGDGCVVHGLDADNGEVIETLNLTAAPVFDGLIAAGARVFISLENGTVVCLDASKGDGE